MHISSIKQPQNSLKVIGFVNFCTICFPKFKFPLLTLPNFTSFTPTVKVCPWCDGGLLRLSFLCCGVITKVTLLLVSAAPVKRKGARGEVRFPGDPTTMCPVLFKGSRSLLLLACCYVPIVRRMLIFKGGT